MHASSCTSPHIHLQVIWIVENDAFSRHCQVTMPRLHRAEALSDDARLTSDVCLTYFCLSRTSGLSREEEA